MKPLPESRARRSRAERERERTRRSEASGLQFNERRHSQTRERCEPERTLQTLEPLQSRHEPAPDRLAVRTVRHVEPNFGRSDERILAAPTIHWPVEENN